MYNVGRSCLVSGAFKLNQEHVLYNYSSSLMGRLGDGYMLRVLVTSRGHYSAFRHKIKDKTSVYELHPLDPQSCSSTMVVRMPPSVCSGNTHV